MIDQSINNVSEIYSDVRIEKIQIQKAIVGMNGLYLLFSDTSEEDVRKVINSLRTRFGLENKQIFVLIAFNNNLDKIFDNENDVFLNVVNGEQAFLQYFQNKLLPESDLIKNAVLTFDDFISVKPIENPDETAYVVPVLSLEMVESLILYFEEILSPQIEEKGKYKTDEEGNMYVKKMVTQKIGPFTTFLEQTEVWFPCMEEDGDRFFLITALTGMFGGHKLKHKSLFQFLYYLLFLSCGGVLYILDLISILIGGYHFQKIVRNDAGELEKKTIYSRPMSKKGKILGFLFLPVCVLIAYSLVKYLFVPALSNFSIWLGETLSQNEGLQQLFSQFY